ncbi:NAD(P)/FAD-dependent oxidoreductase, partial [Oceanivirga salmonicida]
AEYKINTRTTDGRGVYTFCMCPGGVVVPAASEKGYLAVNGMSYNKRDLENANSAVLVNVMPDDLGDDILAGVEFQREIEKKAYELGGSNYCAPIQLVKDYIKNVKSTKLLNVKPSYSIGFKLSNLNEILPEYLNISLREGLIALNRKIKGFSDNGAILTGVESRSSSPIRIVRDDNMYSSVSGIIPCGEGAGYAGGIMSAAVDGIRCAEKIIRDLEGERK